MKRPLRYVLLVAAAHALVLPTLYFYRVHDRPDAPAWAASLAEKLGLRAGKDATGGTGAGASSAKAKAQRPVPVILVKAAARDVPVWLEGFGAVEAYNTVTVRPRVSGLIDSVNFTEGQTVEKDAVLARIDPRPYASVLEQARARLAQTLAKRRQDEALLNNARSELERVTGLVKSSAESVSVLERQQAEVARLSAAVAEDEAAVKGAEASIAAAQLDMDFTTLRSPIAGVAGKRLLDAGNTVTANQSEGLVVVTQTRPISVVFTLPQKHLYALRPHMKPGAKALTVQAFRDDTGETIGEGALTLIDNQVVSATDSIRLKARFENADAVLWPGLYVGVRVLLETRRNAVLVPRAAVQDGLNDTQFLYVAKPDMTVEARFVKTGTETAGGDIVVESGVAAGEQVVREGQNKLKPGMKVENITQP
ncbi:MAG: efflux RND transporter periplasmic adaptor subunit [Puniceicoccales bacterium]|jgi:multidrug efflux system membrane fusion protein|nr:efflux RND transporter periplasmic adaptor subunit [Puniceicoccales bacterium]